MSASSAGTALLEPTDLYNLLTKVAVSARIEEKIIRKVYNIGVNRTCHSGPYLPGAIR